MLASWVVNTISWVPILYQPVNDYIIKHIPNVPEVNWLAIISGVVFIGFAIWTIWDLSKRIERSEDKKPSIGVEPFARGQVATLEVTNEGGVGTFHAEFRIVLGKDARWQTSGPYRMYWKGHGEKAILNKSDTGVIVVAEQFLVIDKDTHELSLYHVQHVVGNTVKSSLLYGDWPGIVCLQISITADPTLQKQFDNKVYKLAHDKKTDEITFELCQNVK